MFAFGHDEMSPTFPEWLVNTMSTISKFFKWAPKNGAKKKLKKRSIVDEEPNENKKRQRVEKSDSQSNFEDLKRPQSVILDGDLVFQLLDCEDASKDKLNQGCLLRMFGTTCGEQSVCVYIQNYMPYMYFPVSTSFCKNEDLPTFSNTLHDNFPGLIARVELIGPKRPLMYYRPDPASSPHTHSEDLRYTRFVQIFVHDPSCLNRITKFLEGSDNAESSPLSELFRKGKLYDTTSYESNISPELRFMVDRELVGGGWVLLPAGSYSAVPFSNPDTLSRCQINIFCSAENVYSLTTTPTTTITPPSHSGQVQATDSVSPLRVMCMMITTLGDTETGSTCNGASQMSRPIGFIACLLTRKHTRSADAGSSRDKVIIFCHHPHPQTFVFGASTGMTKVQCPSAAFTASPSDDGNIDVDVQNFANEREMLLAFRECFLGYDPDVLTGYDVVEHLVQIMARADVLLPGTELSGQFAYFSRLPNEKTKASRKQIYAAHWVRSQRRMSANSNREFKVLTMAGRIVLDMRQIIERDERLRTYSFAEAVYSITKKTKEVLDERQLTHLWLWDGSAESRRRVLDYCRRDVQRCMELVRNGASLITYIEMARVTGLNISETFHRGQMIRFFSQLFRYCRQRNILVPSQTDRNDSGMTEGPLNFYPEVGFNTEDACVVLDFRSLYPSIIMAHNLSYDTIINKSDLALLPSAEGEHLYEAGLGPMESYFVKSSVRKGIVPIVLQDMLDERGKVRKKMATFQAEIKGLMHQGGSEVQEKLEELKLLHTILNGRQLAYKVAANAIYGFTGSRDSKLQCLPIAESTILHGAHMLAKLKQEIEDTFRVDNGFPIDCYVLYGDTDSVFVCMPRTSVADAFKYGKEIAVRMTEKFPRPIQLEFEKVYFPFVLLNRKRYAGLQWTMVPKPTDRAMGTAEEHQVKPVDDQLRVNLMSGGAESDDEDDDNGERGGDEGEHDLDDSTNIAVSAAARIELPESLQIVMVPKAEKIDAKGIESQRRDSCPLLTKMITNALIQLFPRNKCNDWATGDVISADERKTCVERASEYIKAVVGKMLAGDYDMGEFIMTKGLWLGTNTEDYKGKQVHTELVKRMRARDPNLNFADGERIRFVFLKAPYVSASQPPPGSKNVSRRKPGNLNGNGGSPLKAGSRSGPVSTSITNHAYEKSEDPLFALEKDLELDYRYYLDHQLVNQLTRIFDVMLSPQPKRTGAIDPNIPGAAAMVEPMLYSRDNLSASLFRGDHVRFARNRVSAVPKGISAYFDKSQEYSVCMECRVRVPADRALCDSCLPKLRTVYQRTLDTNNTNEIERTQLASNCRQCQGSQFREILCVNSDCDVFYKRKHRELNSKRNVDAVQRIESAKDWTLDW